MKRYGIEYQQKSTFNSVDINIKKICEWFGIHNSVCEDTANIWNMSNAYSSGIHLIELKT
jgi:hypothetical protein